MPNMDDNFSNKMTDLRKKYLSQLSIRQLEFLCFLDNCEQNKASDEELKTAQGNAHKLAGSGKTYGFNKISEAGKALEDALTQRKSQQILADLTKTLLEACKDALSMP